MRQAEDGKEGNLWPGIFPDVEAAAAAGLPEREIWEDAILSSDGLFAQCFWKQCHLGDDKIQRVFLWRENRLRRITEQRKRVQLLTVFRDRLSLGLDRIYFWPGVDIYYSISIKHI